MKLFPRSAGTALSGLLLATVLQGCNRNETGPSETDAPKPAARASDMSPRTMEMSDLRIAAAPQPPADRAPQVAPPVQLDLATSDADLPFPERMLRLGPADRARAIFSLMPQIPPEKLAMAAERAVDELPDADYATTVLPVVTNPETHGQALSVLFANLLERPDAITLPALLSIAKNSNHSFAPAALDDLRLLLDADYGQDWTRWGEAIRTKLAR